MNTPHSDSTHTSLAQLFSQPIRGMHVQAIEIPLIQRDYAQGRKNPQVQQIRERFIGSLFDALDSEDGIDLDFVFGDVVEKDQGARKVPTLYPLDGQRQEDFINEHTPVASDHHCQSWGAGYNQRTVWFPDTAVLVAGGHLTAAQRASGQPVRLYALDWINENGDMAPSRPDTREAAYYRVPCVGATRVQGGFATDVAAPLQAGDRLWVRGTSAGARPITLTLPVAPFVVLEPHRAADALDRFGIAPMRLVLATVDMPRRRLVLHWQATAPQQPALRLVTYERWTAEARDTHGKPFPAAMRHVIERHLSACPPAAQPPEPCAQPARYRSAQDLAAELSP